MALSQVRASTGSAFSLVGWEQVKVMKRRRRTFWRDSAMRISMMEFSSAR